MCLLRVYAWTLIQIPSNTGRSMCRVAESCFKILWNVRNLPLVFSPDTLSSQQDSNWFCEPNSAVL